MKKFMDVVKLQAELAAKAASGKATADELKELAKLTAAIQTAAKAEEKPSTALKAMTLGEYQTWHDTTMKEIEDGKADPKLLALAKRNLAAVKAQGKTDAEDVVAVEMPVLKEQGDKVAELENRIVELEAKIADNKQEGGETPPAAPAAPAASAANGSSKPISAGMAMEAIDALLAKYGKVKTMIESGSVDAKALYEIWGSDWNLKQIIEQACAVMSKSAELNKASEAIIPALEKMEQAAPPAAEPPAVTPPAVQPPIDPKSGQTKGKDASRWESGLDIAPRRTAKEQAQAIKTQKHKYGY